MTDKEAIEEIKSLLLALGGQEYLKEEEPENYKLSKAIETILNLIQTQQEEIEKYKILLAENCARTLNSDLKQKNKHEEDLEVLHLGWKQAIEKKDKIINEMSKYINFKIDGKNTPKQWKEYFINKVEKESK